MSEHALLSASAAHRWLACPPSAKLEAAKEDTGSEFAREGTLAHAIGELKLKKHFGLEKIGPKTLKKRLAALIEADENKGLYQKEMDGYTDGYCDYVAKCAIDEFAAAPYAVIEQRVDYSDFAPGGFGTADCVLLGGDLLHIIDLKYGKGVPVDAVNNPQLKLYALGAMMLYAAIYDIKRVKLSVYQPRIDNISEWETTADALLDWGQNTVRPIALLAYEGKGDFAAGEHCRFCRIKGSCRIRAESMLELESRKGAELTPEEIGEVLKRAAALKEWVDALKDNALKTLEDGGIIPGWKLVEGRSVRQFTDAKKAFDAIIASGVKEEMLYERNPLTLAQIEKLMGKAEFAKVCDKYVHKPPGKHAIADENDPRPAITRATQAAEAFKDVPAVDDDDPF